MRIDQLLDALATSPGGAPGAALGGDHDLTPGWAPQPPFTPAAVLIPLVDRPEPTVLFTTRSASLPVHPGQVSFPGGRTEPEDADAAATALRETEEELGLDRSLIRAAGELAPYVTRTGFLVTPVVGTLTPPLSLKPDPVEVAEVFEVPLSFLLSPQGPRRDGRVWQGARREFWVFDWQGHYIWGATAGMLMGLRRRLGCADPVPA